MSLVIKKNSGIHSSATGASATDVFTVHYIVKLYVVDLGEANS